MPCQVGYHRKRAETERPTRSCAGCICRPDKSVVIKSITFANARDGWQIWEEKLSQLDAPPSQILIGMEATSRDAGESLS